MFKLLRFLCGLSLFAVLPSNTFGQQFVLSWSGPFGNGTATVTATPKGGGLFLVTSMSNATQNGSAITLLPPGVYTGDNLILPSNPAALVDNPGISFRDGVNNYNIFLPIQSLIPSTHAIPGAYYECSSGTGSVCIGSAPQVASPLTFFKITPLAPPAIVIPGVMGTSLYLGNVLLWVNCTLAPGDDSYLQTLDIDANGNSVYPIQTGSVFDGSLPCLKVATGELDFYGKLIQSLKDNGYELDKTLFVFPYDWRLDNATNASKLNAFIETTVIPQSGQSTVDILAHSMGGLVTRAYAATYGESRLDKIIYMGTPHGGSPKAFATLVNDSRVDTSLGITVFPINAQALAQFASTLPSVFQLMPRDPFIESSGKLSLDESYLDPPQGFGFLRSAAWVAAANAFHSSISSPLTVAQFEIAGSGIPTLNGLQLVGDPAIKPRVWCSIPGNGDSTVPLLSATGAPGSNIQVFYADGIAHDALPNNAAVQSLVLTILGNNSTTPLPPGISTVPFSTGPMIDWCSHSPINVAIADVNGNVDGLAQDGSIHTAIPFSSFFGLGENQTGLLALNQTYQVGISGTAVGIFSLQFNQEDSSGNVTQTTSFTNVPIGTASKGSFTLSPTGGTPILELDLNGDGVTDVSIPANSSVDAGTSAHILSLIIPTLSLNAGIERSLLAKIEAANDAIHDGEPCEAKRIFTALKDEIADQSGKHVSVAQAKGLLVIVDGMIQQIHADGADDCPEHREQRDRHDWSWDRSREHSE